MTISIKFHGCSNLLNKKKIWAVCSFFLRELGYHHYNLSLLITNDEEIQYLNNKFRNKNKPTNVLSFPFEDSESLPFLPLKELGDIVISEETALKEADLFNQTLEDRINWLIIHGLLHLVGFDHEKSEKDAELMFERERELLQKLLKFGSKSMIKLAINVDHVATVRQARGISEPDPVAAAAICEFAGASGIVIHLREDRRHIQDKDVYLLRETVKTKLNLEMGANKEIIDIALDVEPDMITLVPEKREELTTEGGLDVISQKKKLAKVIKKFEKVNIPTSIFIDPDPDQIHAVYDIGATFVEIHTGRYCDAVTQQEQDAEFDLIFTASQAAHDLGLIVNGGHGLDYQNCGRIASIDVIDELSIGHSIISRSIFTGLDQAVRDMLQIIRNSQIQ